MSDSHKSPESPPVSAPSIVYNSDCNIGSLKNFSELCY